jgi:hypothetical protein
VRHRGVVVGVGQLVERERRLGWWRRQGGVAGRSARASQPEPRRRGRASAALWMVQGPEESASDVIAGGEFVDTKGGAGVDARRHKDAGEVGSVTAASSENSWLVVAKPSWCVSRKTGSPRLLQSELLELVRYSGRVKVSAAATAGAAELVRARRTGSPARFRADPDGVRRPRADTPNSTKEA